MISGKPSAVLIPAIVLALLNCHIAQANLVTNGGFEFYTGTAPKDFTSNCLPTDWSTGGYVYLDAPGTAVTPPGIQVWGLFPNTSPQGGNFIESDGMLASRFLSARPSLV